MKRNTFKAAYKDSGNEGPVRTYVWAVGGDRPVITLCTSEPVTLKPKIGPKIERALFYFTCDKGYLARWAAQTPKGPGSAANRGFIAVLLESADRDMGVIMYERNSENVAERAVGLKEYREDVHARVTYQQGMEYEIAFLAGPATFERQQRLAVTSGERSP